MANISSINGNPIVVGTSGIEDGAITPYKLSDDISVSGFEIPSPEKLIIVLDTKGYIDASDEIASDQRYRCTSYYIKIPKVWFLPLPELMGCGVVRYDSEKNLISRDTITNRHFLYANNASYIRISVVGQVDQLEIAAKPSMTPDGAYMADEVPLNSITGLVNHNVIKAKNICDNIYIANATGGPVYGENYLASLPFEIEPNETYRFNKGRSYAWYDENRDFISGEISIPSSGITAPENARYLALSINKTSDSMSYAEAFTKWYGAKASEYDPTEPKMPVAQRDWCYGMTINWIGDSIVAGADFDEVVASAMNLNETDYGVNGSTIALKDDGTNPRNAICLRYADMGDADIIAVSAGTNDFQYSIPDMGTIQSTENTTFYGALKTLCEGLINKYPQKIIFFTTPIKRGQPFDGTTEITTPFSQNAKGYTLKDYRDAIIEVCGYYSIPVLDLWGESLLNPHLESQFNLFDNYHTHPLAAGQRIMARRVCGWLSQLGHDV